MTGGPMSVPRLCHIAKSDGFEGFGFKLYQEKSRSGHFIGRIEHGSPAEMAGLKMNDRIVEVNGVDIGRENHTQVVGRIKAIASETTLLVADKDCQRYHKEHGIVIKESLPYVEYISSEGFASDEEDLTETCPQVICLAVKDDGNNTHDAEETVEGRVGREDGGVLDTPDRSDNGEMNDGMQYLMEAISGPCNGEEEVVALDLNMTAKEMREKVNLMRKGDQRRREGRRKSLDWWKQYKMIQNL